MTPQNEAKLISVLERLDRNLERFTDTAALQGQVIRHDVRIDNLERRMDDTEDEVETTGTIYLDEVKKKVHEYEGDKKYWVRYVVAGIVGIVMLVISAGIGYLARR